MGLAACPAAARRLTTALSSPEAAAVEWRWGGGMGGATLPMAAAGWGRAAAAWAAAIWAGRRRMADQTAGWELGQHFRGNHDNCAEHRHKSGARPQTQGSSGSALSSTQCPNH